MKYSLPLAAFLFLLTVNPVTTVSILPADGYSATASQESFWVFFTDKEGVAFDPYAYFDEKAITRRKALDVCLYDPLNFPVKEEYIREMEKLTDGPVVASRWFNAVHLTLCRFEAMALEELDFVREVRPATMRLVPAAAGFPFVGFSAIGKEHEKLFHAQKSHMYADYFGDRGLDGTGIRIAVFDAGFRGVKTHAAFRHLFENDQIIATWDFHRQRENVYVSSAHGTMVLSAIAGILDEGSLGMATGAEFLLARTEIFREPMAEEQYWLAAVEWADKKGADIINSSLGYIFHRYFPEEMDGRTSLVARAATIAAQKGILVVNAAGNMGNNDQWRIIVTPADADSVLTVGALEFPSMLRASYSSVGPAADGRRKPNVSALGTVIAANRRRLTTVSGTSFAGPQVTAFAACLWQNFPSMSNMDLFRAIERSASLHPYYDYAHGHGVPRAAYFFDDQIAIARPTFDLYYKNDSLHIQLRDFIQLNQDTKDQKKTENEYLYYQLKNENGRIEKYFVIDLQNADKVILSIEGFEPGKEILVHFRGYTSGIRL
ncbi:MAG: peptidase [Bacteroidia bacterium]|nr:MAG: peptidase [Bacteroidia bacterium]